MLVFNLTIIFPYLRVRYIVLLQETIILPHILYAEDATLHMSDQISPKVGLIRL